MPYIYVVQAGEYDDRYIVGVVEHDDRQNLTQLWAEYDAAFPEDVVNDYEYRLYHPRMTKTPLHRRFSWTSWASKQGEYKFSIWRTQELFINWLVQQRGFREVAHEDVYL